jgi:ketosteroid isomerase-like protein
MIRSTCFSALFLSCCVAIAQNPPAQTAPASSGVTTTQSADLTLFQKIEDTWANAVNQHDQYSIENVLSPLFVDVAANGDITTRNQQIVQVLNSDDKTIWLTQKVITVRMLGDIAVANGTYTLHHRVNSATVDEKGVFTHVFERLRGGWVCVNSQRTAVKEDTPNSKQKKQSAGEPFHFPLFSKDKDSKQ